MSPGADQAQSRERLTSGQILQLLVRCFAATPAPPNPTVINASSIGQPLKVTAAGHFPDQRTDQGSVAAHHHDGGRAG